MTDDLTSIIETLKVIERENKHSDEILDVLSCIVELLNNCSPTRLTKAHLTRTFKLARLIVEVKYNGTL